MRFPFRTSSGIFQSDLINEIKQKRSLRGVGIRSRLVRDEPRKELNELAGGGYGETVFFECFGKLRPGIPVLLRVVEEAPKQRVNDVFFENFFNVKTTPGFEHTVHLPDGVTPLDHMMNRTEVEHRIIRVARDRNI